MNKKITSSALAALMIAGSTSFTALAAMANGTVVIGNKAFDLAYANDPAHAAEITNAIVASGVVYVKDFTGKWISNTTGATVDASVIPAVTYKSATGVVTEFDAKDMDKVTTLAVTSVSATNLKTIVVSLNGEADVNTLNATTVKLEKAGSDVVSARSLSADNKSLVIEFAGVAQSDQVKLTINGLKDLNGKELKDYTNTVTVTDTTVPTASSAVAVNAKQVEVYFNEPINFTSASYQILNNVKIDGVAVIAKATPNNVKNSIVFDLPTALAAGAHAIEVSDMSDYATYKAVKAEFSITVGEDKLAPVLVNAEVKNVNTVEVTFNEKVEVLGTFKVNGTTVTTVTPVTGSNNTKFALTGGFSALDLGAIVEIKVAYAGQEDVIGNKVATEVEYKFNVKDDTILPTVGSKFGADNKLTLTFSKSMQTNLGTVKVSKKDGTLLGTVSQPFTFKTGSNETILEISSASLGLDNIDKNEIVLNIKGMKDNTIRANLLPETNINLAVNDTKKPIVDANFFAQDGTTTAEDTVTFYFSEAMDVETLKNLSNYVGSTVGALASVSDVAIKSVAADAKSVTIQYKNFRSIKATEAFTVYALKDVNGNMVITKTGVDILPSTALAVTTVEATGASTIKVTFDTKLSSVDPSALKVISATDASDQAVFIKADLDETGKIVTFTTNKALGTDSSLYKIKENNVNLIKNVYNVALTTPGATSIVDKVAPTVSLATGSATGQIKLTFSEMVNALDLATFNGDIIVRDEKGVIVTSILPSALIFGTTESITAFKTVEIDLGAANTGKTYSVEVLSRNIKDASASANKVTSAVKADVVIK